MYKKILGLLVVAFGLSTAAFADDFASESSLSGSNSSDFIPGIYFGGQFGMTNLHYSGSSYTKNDTGGSSYDDKYHFAGRGFAGYAFNQHIWTELGYTYYGKPKFKHTSGNTQNILQQGLDLMVKANLPLDYGFGLYIKGGLAWVFRSALTPNTGMFADKDSNSKVVPVGAVGINYWFAPNIAIDLCYTKTMTISNLPTTDLYTIGFIYKINI